MIVYDSHRWYTLCRIRGSVFPRSIVFALPSTIFAALLKYCATHDLIDLDNFDLVHGGGIYEGFTFTLGFVLVFRASQAYQRYWLAATAVHTMRAQWFDACSALVAFAQTSKFPRTDVIVFMHTAIRLFCLLHAMALEEIADLADENFPLLDIGGLSREHLDVLAHETRQGRKVEIVYQWIQIFITQAQASGLLCVPPPILTRTFQFLGSGMISYHSAQLVTIWPFPFAYAQVNVVLITIYIVITPFIMSTWTIWPLTCALYTMLSCLCMVSLDFIAVELENPFGMDYNDLPTWQLQIEMNRDLAMLINHDTMTVPQLTKQARMFSEIMEAADGTSLAEYTDAPPARVNCQATKQMRYLNAHMCNFHGDVAKLGRALKLFKQSDGEEDEVPPAVMSKVLSLQSEQHSLRTNSVKSTPATEPVQDKAKQVMAADTESTLAATTRLVDHLTRHTQVVSDLGERLEQHVAQQDRLFGEQACRQAEANDRLFTALDQITRKLSSRKPLASGSV